MATNLVCNKARVVAYLPSLRAAVRHFRVFSSYDERKPANQYPAVDITTVDDSSDWPDSKLGPLNPQDGRFPLPGYVGVHKAAPVSTIPNQPLPQESDLFTGLLPLERHRCAIHDFVTANKEIEQQEANSRMMDESEEYDKESTVFDCLECIAQDCPKMMRSDFASLFPEHEIMSGPFTVITISQKTENDMSGWNPQVEEEREILLEHFMIGAEEICKSLQCDGYWADFIDPTSGRPYLGPYTNATMFETDERYRNFGFEIEDLGCCKVIRHHVWGTHAYIGCLFTNAPLSHPALAEFSKSF